MFLNLRQIPYALGPIIFACSFAIPSDTLSADELAVLGILGWMLIWWVSEVVNLAVTALLPILLLPLCGILPIKEVTALYGHHLIFLFFGGFVLALAIEKWNLHQRIALYIIRKVGSSPMRILLGFMLATSFLSAWISNTATTVMMLPMAMSVLKLLENAGFKNKKVSISILIGVAWAANIGGISTLIGTPPNVVFTSFYEENYGHMVNFSEWIKIGLPVAVTLFLIAYWVLAIRLRKVQFSKSEVETYFEKEWSKLGPMSAPERRVAIVFTSTALLWIFRPQIVQILNVAEFTDTSVAILSALSLFVVPANSKRALLKWKDTKKLAWGILILFGGGLALAAAMNQSGLLTHLTDLFESSNGLHLYLWILAMAALGIWATEVMSNMALVAAMMPIVAAISAASGIPFFTLALPLTLGSSCAFMLPMATPPNAIVFGSGQLKIIDMVRRGLTMNILATLVISVVVYMLSIAGLLSLHG